MEGSINKTKLFGDINVIDEAVVYGYKLCRNNKMSDALSLLLDVKKLVKKVENTLNKEDDKLLLLAAVCCKNLCYSISSFEKNSEKKLRIYELEILNLLWNLKIILHDRYKTINNDSRERADAYLEKSMNMHELVKKNSNKKYKYKVSIVVTAYNKIEYTKAAIESIYKYTDFSKGDIELITRNNGSSDETEQYFESLPNEKKINYKYNVLGTVICPDILEGKYIVSFSNDVVATPHWLENLIKCMESDDNIISVVPTCQNYAISCNQGIAVDYQNTFADLDKMEAFAAEYNKKSNPSLWEERPLLMPFVAMVRHELSEINLQDPSYTQAQFIDDDISTVYRRTGWKQMLAKDTFMHHFGSITLKDMSGSGNTNAFINMRKVYFDKWKVDAWKSKGIIPIHDEVLNWPDYSNGDNILWIDPLFGYGTLTLKNNYRKENKKLNYTKALVSNVNYKQDAEMYFSDVEVYDNLCRSIAADNHKYNIITTSCYINDIIHDKFVDTVELLLDKLNDGGWLLLPIRNCISAYDIASYIFKINEDPVYVNDIKSYNQVDVRKILQELRTEKPKFKYKIKYVTVKEDEEIIHMVTKGIKAMVAPNDVEENSLEDLKIRMIWLGVQKI